MRRKLHTYGTLLIYCIALGLCAVALSGCISGRSWQTFKAHGQEVGIAAAGGALGVFTGGAVGVAIVVAGMATGAFVGEMDKPPSKDTHTTTVIDKDGHIIDQKTTQDSKASASAGVIAMFSDFTATSLKWIVFFAILVIAFKAAFGDRYRTLLAGFLMDLMGAVKLLATLQPSAAIAKVGSAVTKLRQASGMAHTSPVTTMTPEAKNYADAEGKLPL